MEATRRLARKSALQPFSRDQDRVSYVSLAWLAGAIIAHNPHAGQLASCICRAHKLSEASRAGARAIIHVRRASAHERWSLFPSPRLFVLALEAGSSFGRLCNRLDSFKRAISHACLRLRSRLKQNICAPAERVELMKQRATRYPNESLFKRPDGRTGERGVRFELARANERWRVIDFETRDAGSLAVTCEPMRLAGRRQRRTRRRRRRRHLPCNCQAGAAREVCRNERLVAASLFRLAGEREN